MSAAERLVTREGNGWTLRGRNLAGEGLYAPDGVPECPPHLLVTASELAEHGVRTLLGPDVAAELEAAPSANRLRSMLAPSAPVDEHSQASPLEEPHDSPLHHDYRVGRDLPETGGDSR